MESYFTEQEFANRDGAVQPLPIAEYEACIFTNCNFSNTNISKCSFIDCSFQHCDCSNANLHQTIIRDVSFHDCKMLGLHFDACNDFLFSAIFKNCTLSFSSFYKLKLKGILFKDCTLHEVDFAGCDLTGAFFNNCDLKGAIFDRTTLEKADLSTAYNYIIDPENNRIKKAKFAAAGLAGLLGKYDIVIK
ncbi:MAG: pentapeptide repeat-containing protein [Niabella sp.]